jgi:beta-glucosidase
VTQYQFPEGFLWGAATSAYQIEGSPLTDGAGPSILHRFAHTPGNTFNGDTGDIAADHYRRVEEDVAIMRDLGLQTYQFSVAWPRVIPDGTGTVNRAGLDFYDRLVELLLEAGIAPAPILHVWDLPASLQDHGGWANRDTAERFAGYASVVFDRLGDRATHWLTICEPYVVAHGGYIGGDTPPGMRDLYAGLRAAHHVQLAHGRAVQAFRASDATGQIGTSSMAIDIEPATSDPADVAAAERTRAYMNALFLDPVMLGEYPAEIVERFADAWPPIADGDMATISTPVDFLGFTYYLGATAADANDAVVERTPAKEGGLDRDVVEDMLDVRLAWRDGPQTALSWPIHPDGVRTVLHWLRDRYGNPPIVMTENGAAFADTVTDGRVNDVARVEYIRAHLQAAHRAIEEGVDLRGWFVWSLLDTWEFSLGYKGRFGLVHVDYETQRRTIKDSGWWFRGVMANNGFEG